MTIPSQMRALVLNGVGFEHLALKAVPTPQPGAGQLLARVDAAGICTSLIKLIEQGPKHSYLYGWDVNAHPLILGDEGSITLVKIGEGLRDQYEIGERYVVQPAIDHGPINHRERYANVESVHKLGVGYTLAGHLAEYILIPEEILEAGCLVPLPDATIPYAHAAMSEPISCAVSGQDHHLRLRQETPHAERDVVKGLKRGGVTVIVGAGAMGRMHVDLALNSHPKAVVVSDLIDERLRRVHQLFADKAERLGVALHTINGRDKVEALIAQLSNYHGADDVIVAVGSGKAIEIAQHYVGRGGVLNLFGGLKKGEDVIGLDTAIAHYKEVVVTGSSGGSPGDVERTLELMAQGGIDASAHITRIGDLDHAISFLKMVKAQELDGKAVVYPHRRTDSVLEVDAWTAEDENTYLG